MPGPLKTFVQAPKKIVGRARRELLRFDDRRTDKKLGIDTWIRGFTLESRLLGERNHGNEGTHYHAVRQIFDRVGPGPQDVFCDIGCGYARVVCYAAQRPLRKAIGVELRDEVAAQAAANARNVRGASCPVEVIHGDATIQDYSDCSYIYLYNPFDADVMRIALAKIRADRGGKPTRFVYVNPTAQEVLADAEWLEKTDEFRVPYQQTRMLVTAWRSGKDAP